MKHIASEKKLNNGTTVLFIDVPGASSFDLAIAINAGYRFSSRDNISKYEIPHLLEHLVFDGSRNYATSDELQNIFSSNGGVSNGITTPYHNIYVFHNRLQGATTVLEAALDMVFFPQLSKKSFDEEYKVVKNEIVGNLGDFAGNAVAYSLQQVIPELPCSSDFQLEQLPNVNYDDVTPYHRNYYTSANTTLMIAADFKKIKKSTFEKIILESMDKVPLGVNRAFPRFTVAPANPSITASVAVNKSTVDTTASVMFLRTMSASPKEILALGLFTTIATNMKSYSVNYKLRKQGLVYSIDFSASESIETSGFELNIAANNQKFNEVYAYTLGYLRDLEASGISEEQFETAKRDYCESFEDSVESTDGVIGWYLQDYLMDRTIHTPIDSKKLAASITQSDMLEIAKNVLQYDNLYQSVFSSKSLRAATSMQMLASEILSKQKNVDEQLVEQNSLAIDDTNKTYIRIMYTILILILALFIVPLSTTIDKESLSHVYLAGLDFPWNFVAPIYFGILFILPIVTQGRELRMLTFQMLAVFSAWAGIMAAFDWQSFTAPFISHNLFISVHAWLLSGTLAIGFSTALYSILRNSRRTRDALIEK